MCDILKYVYFESFSHITTVIKLYCDMGQINEIKLLAALTWSLYFFAVIINHWLRLYLMKGAAN